MANRGGARLGAGRKPAPYKQITMAVKIPAELHQELSKIIKKTILKWKQSHTNSTEKQF